MNSPQQATVRTQIAAIFDVDGTLVRGNAIDYYLFFVKHLSNPVQRFLKRLAVPMWGPYWLLLDRIDRRRFNRSFYRQYRGFSVARMQELAQACFQDVFVPRLIPETLRRAEQHRARGERILLVSGTLDFILAPLAEFLGAEAVLSPSLAHEAGIYQGRIAGKNVVGSTKAEVVTDYARQESIDLSRSYAYGDSLSDASLLSQVGRPIVVDPDRKLLSMANRLGWEKIISEQEGSDSAPQSR